MDSKQCVIETAANCSRKRKERKKGSTPTVASLCAAILLTAIPLLTRVDECTASSNPPDDPPPPYWRRGYEAGSTLHEKLGSAHFGEIIYSKYEPVANYSQRENFTRLWTDDFFKFSRTIFDHMFPHDLNIPRGYIKDLGTDNMRLGQKFTHDDWALWLNQFWMIWLWVLVMVAIIVLAPFLCIVYFCFCCHRCKLRCPACYQGAVRKRVFWGFCLTMILPLIAGSMALAFSSNSMIERGLRHTKAAFETGTVDTCNFLKDVGDHIYHLFVKNYEELETHVVTILTHAPKHFFKDLNDVASDNAVVELHRTFLYLQHLKESIEYAHSYSVRVQENANNLRNDLRAVKRNINYAMTALCGSYECLKFLHTADIEYMDTSRCLHLDELPNGEKMVQELIAFRAEYNDEPPLREPIARLRNISMQIRDTMARASPAIIRDLRKGRRLFARESRRIEDIIDVVISDIHLFTIRASRPFQDIYDIVNNTRQLLDLYITVSLLVIMSILILALIVGCVAPVPTLANDAFFTTKIASHLLILAMICIFCALSVMLTVVLFYFLIGGVAYKGACAQLADSKSTKSSALLEQLDSEINLRTMFSLRNAGVGVGVTAAGNKDIDPIKVSTVVEACQGDDFLFNFLQNHEIFDIDDFLRVRILSPAERESDIDIDLSKVYILSDEEKDYLRRIENADVGLYHSSMWFDVVCEGNLKSLKIDKLMKDIRSQAKSLSWSTYRSAAVGLENAYVSLAAAKSNNYKRLDRSGFLLGHHLWYADYRATYQNYNFGDGIRLLRERTEAAEKFIQERGTEFIKTLAQNLTAEVEARVKDYIRMIIREAHTKIGRCKPLTYIYEHSLEMLCQRLIDPINGYWMGLLLAALLMIPVLFIAHRLQCLYRQHKLVPPITIRESLHRTELCPFCSANSNRMPGGDISGIGQDGAAERKIFDVEISIEEPVDINDGDRKNKLD